jgi:hypothetical protein
MRKRIILAHGHAAGLFGKGPEWTAGIRVVWASELLISSCLDDPTLQLVRSDQSPESFAVDKSFSLASHALVTPSALRNLEEVVGKHAMVLIEAVSNTTVEIASKLTPIIKTRLRPPLQMVTWGPQGDRKLDRQLSRPDCPLLAAYPTKPEIGSGVPRHANLRVNGSDRGLGDGETREAITSQLWPINAFCTLTYACFTSSA